MKPILLGLTLLLALPVGAQNKITVRALDPQNAPIAGANVDAMVMTFLDRLFLSEVTGADGTATFDIPDNSEGRMVDGTFCVTKPGFGFTNCDIPRKDVDIHLQPGMTLKGKVQNEAGEPIPGVTVQCAYVTVAGNKIIDGRVTDILAPRLRLISKRGLETYSAKSGADGSFSIADLPVGIGFQCQIDYPNYVLKAFGLRPNVENTLKLVASGGVHGRLLDLVGQPVVGASVSIFPTRPAFDKPVKTDAEGFYSLERLEPGSYNLSIQANSPDFVFPPQSNFQVVAGKMLEVPEIHAVAGALIQGVVRDAVTQKPLEKVAVSAQQVQPDKAYALGLTDARGRFELRVIPGAYFVDAFKEAAGYLHKIVQRVEADGSSKGLIFDLPKETVLYGVMVDEAGKPVQGKLKVGYSPSFIEANAQGRWEYQPTSTYPVAIMGADVGDDYFEVVSGPDTLNPIAKGLVALVLRKKPLLTLKGRALTSDGKPLEGVKIKFTYSYAVGRGRRVESAARKATTDAKGDFVLTGIRDRIRVESKYFDVVGSKDGYVFQKGGLSVSGSAWKITDLIFAPLP